MTLGYPELTVPGGGATTPFAPAGIRNAAGTVKTAAEKIVWGVARFLLSAGETVNSAWDVGLDSALGLLKTGGAVYDSVAAAVVHVPVFGFGAAGVGEAIKTSLAVAESNAKHDMEVRKEAFATLNNKLSQTGIRLYGPTAANPVVFPHCK